MEEKTFEIPKISCGHCVATIERAVGGLDGVDSVEGDAQARRVTVRWTAPADWDSITRTLTEIGYPAKE